jgi:hypothetical protein
VLIDFDDDPIGRADFAWFESMAGGPVHGRFWSRRAVAVTRLRRGQSERYRRSNACSTANAWTERSGGAGR